MKHFCITKMVANQEKNKVIFTISTLKLAKKDIWCFNIISKIFYIDQCNYFPHLFAVIHLHTIKGF